MSNLNTGNKDEENLGSFYMGRMRPPPEPKRILPKGFLTGAALLAFVAIIWYAYPQGQEKYSGVDVPVITADKSVYKFKPENPGGMEVRHQDSTVFDPLDKKEIKVEKLLPTPEEPMDKEEALKARLDADKPKLNLDLQMSEAGKGVEKVVAKTDVRPLPKPEPELKKVVEVKKEEPSKALTTEPAKDAVKKTAETLKASPATTVKGVYIQLGSYRDASGAKTDWEKLQQKYPQFLKGLSMKTVRVDLGKKGIWNRLYAGSLPETRAKEICAVLKTENPGGCIVMRK